MWSLGKRRGRPGTRNARVGWWDEVPAHQLLLRVAISVGVACRYQDRDVISRGRHPQADGTRQNTRRSCGRRSRYAVVTLGWRLGQGLVGILAGSSWQAWCARMPSRSVSPSVPVNEVAQRWGRGQRIVVVWDRVHMGPSRGLEVRRF